MMLLGEVRSDMALELLEQKRCALLPPTLVTNRVLDLDLVQDSAIVELDEKRVADGALGRLVVLDAETLVLDAGDLGTKGVNAGILRSLIRVRLGGELAEDERIRDHVVDVVARRGEVHE